MRTLKASSLSRNVRFNRATAMTMRATITCCSLVIKAPVIKELVIETGAEAAPVAVAVVQRPDEEHEIDDQQPGVHPAVSRLDVTAVAIHHFLVGLKIERGAS